MNNGNMPAAPILDKKGTPWNLTDGNIDGDYLKQPNQMFATGLTKREHFATMAMQGLMSNSGLDLAGNNIIILAVEAADRLLKALEQQS